MKKIINITSLFLFLFLTTGCYTLWVEAPGSKNVKLAYSTESTPQENFEVVAKKKVFYLFWGLLPLGDNSTGNMIEKSEAKNLRVVVKADFVDIIIYVLTGGILSSQTVSVETPKK